MFSKIIIVVEQKPHSQQPERPDNYGEAGRVLRVSKTKRRKLPAQIGSNIRFNDEENTICSFGK